MLNRLIPLFFVCFSACSSGDNIGTGGPRAPKPNQGDHKGPGTDDVIGKPNPKPSVPTPVDAQLRLELHLKRQSDAQLVPSFADVGGTFQACAACHAGGRVSPDLSVFPFVSSANESLGAIMTKVAQRMNDADRPMPPRGLLASEERDLVKQWIDAGFPASPAPSTPTDELAAYRVELSWSIDQTESKSNFPGNQQGIFSQPLGELVPGTKIIATARVIGPRDIVVLSKTYPALGLPRSGVLVLPIQALAVDVLAPQPGANGELRFDAITHESARLTWTVAADAETAEDSLKYSVYRLPAGGLSGAESAAAVIAAGERVSVPTANISALALSDLNPSTAYRYAVIVEDDAGNAALYPSSSFTTLEDPATIPATEYPNCISGTVTPGKITAWRNAAADALERGTDESAVAERIRQCFSSQVPACVQPVLDYTVRNDTASASQDLTINQSPQKRPPQEFLAPGTSPDSGALKYILPENVEQLAAERGWPAVRYKSRHAGGFDPGTPNLLMVYVPGDKVSPPVNYDRWLNFALPADSGADALTPLPQARVPSASDYAGSNEDSLPRVFTMVTLDRATATKPGQVYFQMFDRQSGSADFLPRSNSDASSCIACHPNGLRAISPLGLHVRDGEAQLPESSWRAAQIINDAMDSAANHKAVSWRNVHVGNGQYKPLFNPAAHGPILGPVTPLNDQGSRTKEFILGGTTADGRTISGCFNQRSTISVVDIFGRAPGLNNVYRLSNNPSIRWEKVRDSMNCASCHDNVKRGAMNELMDMSQVDFKILVDQSMPLGAHVNPLDRQPGSPDAPVTDLLTGDERIALANCLQAEFDLEQKQLKKWLSQTSCQ